MAIARRGEICYNGLAEMDRTGGISSVKTRDFAGRQAAVIALGSSEFGGNCPAEKAFELMDAYVEIGGNFIDTARVYGDFATPKNGESEKVIGRWMALRHNRDRIFLSTKGAHPPLSDMNRGRLSREDVRGDASASLDALGTDHVDVYWLHRDDAARPVGDIMETMQSLIDDGMARSVGVSNWHPARIREANAYAAAHGLTPFCANQPQFSLARQQTVEDPTLVAMDAETYRMHRETNLICVPFSSQAKGFFSKYAELGEEGLPDKAKRRFLCPENLAVYARILEVREQTGLSVGAIALAYLTSQPFPTFPIAGASRVEQVLALAEAGEAAITPEQRDFLRPWETQI